MAEPESRLPWLLRPSGRVDRRRYLVAGFVLVALKVALDAALCQAFGMPWLPNLYWAPIEWLDIGTQHAGRALTFAMVAVPFAWIGAVLSIRRLRDAGLSAWFVVVFAVPFVNLTLIALLLLLDSAPLRRPPVQPGLLPNPLPAVISAVVTIALVWLSVVVFGFYGGALFLGTPFAQGLLVGLLSGSRSLGFATGQLVISGAITAASLLVFGLEGMVCIVMAAPLWFGIAMLGTALGARIARHSVQALARAAPALLLVPVGEWAEARTAAEPSVFEVSTSVTVAAKPEVVWQHLVAFSELPPPTETIFHLGIAYPVRASIEGTGPGAVRRCSFSTGDFVEPIEVWDEPSLLRFSVRAYPQPMVEWNPFHDHVDAEHLHGFFQARRGQFALERRADGGTELVGTTWYSHGLWPETYWAAWSEVLVHTIHRRVLQHIASEAEGR